MRSNSAVMAFIMALGIGSGLLVPTGGARAEDHPLSTITGPGIELKVFDHAFAGSIRDFVVWGEVNEQEFTSELIMRRDGQTIRTAFRKQEDGVLRGTIKHETEAGMRETVLAFVGVDRAKAKIVLQRNGVPVEVLISADGFANNHFENPTYRAALDGQEISFTLKGQACFGYSLHLALLILGAYTH
ncbi:MAG: hypothetical protein HYW49_01665 [Deltaproteobacteria bacterium]|nr:hypothetical protein [Deltaproteobacteria bacterium]